jgi:hypothetical protein
MKPVIKEWKSADGCLHGVIRNGTLMLDKQSQLILRIENIRRLKEYTS